ncbi:hypothetical protein DNK47_03335 [Mycoplasma wenyonii]|uniref:Uncharacterized protein n=1 Tax=Mycoplasma wenyonii TaxID=65123 RepID=A0A328PI61_9MOLU|nr:hypothetical protein [Mycoplasma wenyonii]RAO94753.1 hypothetical protein DNK47_03335 [Mycoplasma wenyonii]
MQIIFEESEKLQESKLELKNLQNNQLNIPTDLFDYETKKSSIVSNIKSIFQEIKAYKKVSGIVEEIQKLEKLISTVKTSILATVLYFAPSVGTKSSK